MVLIRLCHAADLPPPGELVRRLAAAPGAPAPPASSPPARRRRAAARARWAAAAALAEAVPLPSAPAGPRLAGFRDVVALAAEQREALLHARLVHSVHLVRFAPPVIELRPAPDAPRDLASRLAALLLAATGTRWTIALSTAEGEPTLAAQAEAAAAARRDDAAAHPLVRAILDAFPGRAHRGDRGGCAGARTPSPAEAAVPDMPEFAPPDAEPADDVDGQADGRTGNGRNEESLPA